MSHKATNWLSDLSPENMSHAEFRVMFHLCDCHNPSQGCYPAQTYLRAATGLSNGGLNKALSNLEQKGLIQRHRQTEASTKRRQSTRYILGFEIKVTHEPTPLSGDGSKQEHEGEPTPLSGEGSISTLSQKPSPLLAQSHLHPSGDKPVREPVKEPCVSQNAPHTHDFGFDEDHSKPCLKSGHGAASKASDSNISEPIRVSNPDMAFDLVFERFIAAYPRIGHRDETEIALKAALEGGVNPDHILAAAKAYAIEQKGNATQYIAYSENWIKGERWARYPFKSAHVGDVDKNPTASMASAIKSGMHALCQRISVSQAIELIRDGAVTIEEARKVDLVTLNDCRRAGVLQ